MTEKEGYLDFEAYERAKEPHTRQKASAWRTAIGLQDVDGLKVSDYLRETAAVFIIKYLRSCGFLVDNDLFAEHSWYFRNALVRANYRNMAKGIDPDTSFLNRFFRNLLLGERNELKNRYMLINPPEEWKDNIGGTNSLDRTSTEQVPNKLTEQVSDPEIKLLLAVGEQELSLKRIMEIIGIKHRPTLLYNYIEPSIKDGLVTLLYPESPRHPRQKYKLTVKGLAILYEVRK